LEKNPRKNSDEDGGTKVSPKIAQQLSNLESKFSEIDVSL
jgi:hypothetical protein